MVTDGAIVLPQQAAGEAKTFLRVAHDGEDGLIEGLVKSGAQLCEQFTGSVLIARTVHEDLPARGAWQPLARCPVRAITGVEALWRDGTTSVLEPEAYAIDIDEGGVGWVRVTDSAGARQIRVAYEAGMAADWDALPDALRHGVVRIAAHLYSRREGGRDDAPPAAVTALWRPWRRLRIG
jgi:uncharacterized phiE125 gp8 family phage protein